MPLSIRVTATAVNDTAREEFRRLLPLAFAVFSELGRQAHIPEPDVAALLTDNITKDVQRHMQRLDEDDRLDFTPERIGGVVAGKNLPQNKDHSSVVIVFNGQIWEGYDQAAGHTRLLVLHLIAHELAHPFIEHARHISGAMDGVVLPSITAGEMARSATRIFAGEYRADMLAEAFVRQVASTTVDGVTRGVNCWDVFAFEWCMNLATELQRAYPMLPDTVQEYRERRMPLETMWRTVSETIYGLLTLVSHVQAAADAVGGPDILEMEVLKSLPAVGLYLAEPWAQFLAQLRTAPLLPTVEETPTIEERVVRAGEAMLYEIWHRLGLYPEDHPDRTYALWVKEPRRWRWT